MSRSRCSTADRPLRKVAGSLASLALAFGLFASPGTAYAQYGNEPEDVIRDADGRLRGYQEQDVVLDHGGTFLAYVAFVGLTLVGVGVMFKSARRSHLD